MGSEAQVRVWETGHDSGVNYLCKEKVLCTRDTGVNNYDKKPTKKGNSEARELVLIHVPGDCL
jgi:hypothetical protein